MAADLMGEDTGTAGPGEPHVSIRNVHKSYGALKVLEGISFDIVPGEVLVLCGPSGCGKSTLLRCINGLEKIESGDIIVGGVNVGQATADELKRVRTSTGLVFQNFNLFPHMTVLRNIALAPMKIRGMSPDQADDLAHSLLKSIGIPEKADEYPFRLSGGQRQRVAIARALAMEPTLMLFDEPTSSLDPEMREEVLQVIRHVHQERGMTMIVVTHEIGFAKGVASRAMLIEGGGIVEEAPAREFFEHPKQERTRRFVRAIINE